MTADLSYCPQTLDLSAQSLDLSLTQDERLDTFARQDLSYDPQRYWSSYGNQLFRSVVPSHPESKLCSWTPWLKKTLSCTIRNLTRSRYFTIKTVTAST